MDTPLVSLLSFPGPSAWPCPWKPGGGSPLPKGWVRVKEPERHNKRSMAEPKHRASAVKAVTHLKHADVRGKRSYLEL